MSADFFRVIIDIYRKKEEPPMKPLLDCYSLIRPFSFKQKVLIMRVGGIKLKAILRRFTFFIKEIQNKNRFVD